MAHLPGACNHHPDLPLDQAGWGWIPHPDPETWSRLSPTHPLHATEGDTTLHATTRCAHCVHACPA
ncbi:hypothetical protein HNQ79_006660 [Streptomyces candidus]|uniref:Uncharacterized protein n=1 Tax=Streptomyces candidus TaxID=67283 RepID=A0A7X0HLZ1_9ACTN|nr:hypothetical protein [Streptomyces candidus]